MVVTDPVTISQMKIEDVGRVLEIEQLSFPTPWPRDAYTHELQENRLACYLVARVARIIHAPDSFRRTISLAGRFIHLGQAAPDDNRP